MKQRVLLAVLAMYLIAAGNCHAQAVTRPDARQLSPAEQDIWTQEETYWRSLKADDRETYLRLWDERFVGWPRYEGAPAGKEKIRQEYAPGTTVRGKVLDYKLEPLSVRVYGNDVAITFYRATISRGKPSGEVETRTSRLTHTWMRTDQGWKIIGGMSAEGNRDATVTQSSSARDTTKQGSDEVAKAAPAASVANKGENPMDESALSGNKALIRRLFEEEINQKHLTFMESMVADGYVNHNDSVGPTSDIKQGEKFLAAVFAAFPDTHVTIEDIIAEGDKVVVRNTWHGTFRGPWMGIPPTGKEVTWTGIVIWKINNGKITDRWANINFNEVLQKLASNPSKANDAQR